MYFHLFFNHLPIFAKIRAWNWVAFDQVVQLLSQWRSHFDHFVLFLNTRIVQPIENDQFLINDDFNETNMRRGKDERY
ncbi:hypothetical protein DXF86_13205 [Citrobacter freundii]|nr:hypothetical protein DXF86_13205 [Citrobacter freundii]